MDRFSRGSTIANATAERHRPIIAAREARDGPGLQREIETHLDTIVEQTRAA